MEIDPEYRRERRQQIRNPRREKENAHPVLVIAAGVFLGLLAYGVIEFLFTLMFVKSAVQHMPQFPRIR